MMRRIIALFIVLAAVSVSRGQELNLPLSNQYLADNPYVISSAFAGIGDCWQVRLNGLTQWVGIKDSPNTQSLSIDGRIKDNSGVGLIIFNDQNGYTSQKGVQASFAHHLTIDEYNDHYLSFGISYKFTQFGVNTSEFDPTIFDAGLRGDLSLGNSNFEISTLWRYKGLFVSLNAVNLVAKDLDEFGANEPSDIRNYYAYAGYVFKPKYLKWEFEPSVFYQKFDGDTRATTDINFKARKMNREDYYWAGISLRSINDQGFKPNWLSPMFGLKKGLFYAAYSYQINVNEIQPYNAGSHMITIGFDFGCAPSTCSCTW
ncbi:PorP/SprF family type IX secretion system membrane protein [Croceiramulus getboli]|nr:type IX secretion system membrane protein PorP/SprF [Flavobacteriaceae bacterium YJPT1-3]